MTPQTGATAPPFILTLLFMGLTLPVAFTNDPITSSIYDANDEYSAAASPDLIDLSKSHTGNIANNQNLQQPETDVFEENLQQQDGIQHSLQLKNVLPSTDEKSLTLQNTFDTENVDATNQRQLFISKEEDSTAQSSQPDQQESNDTFTTVEDSNKGFSTGDTTTLKESQELATINREQDFEEFNVTTVNTNLESKHFPHDNMPFVTHLDGEASIEQQNENRRSEELELITPQPQLSVVPSKLWYLDGTQHSNVNDNMEQSDPSVHEEKLDNDLIGTLDNPIKQYGNSNMRTDAVISNSNDTTDSLGSDTKIPHQPENELFGDKMETQNNFNINFIKPNVTQVAATNQQTDSELDSSPKSVEENAMLSMMYNSLTTAVNATVFNNSLPHSTSISSTQNGDNDTETNVYNFTLTLSDKLPSLFNRSIKPTSSILTTTNMSATETDNDSKNYNDNVLVSSHWERVFEEHIQHEAAHERSQNVHSDAAFVKIPFVSAAVLPIGNRDATKNYAPLSAHVNRSDDDFTSIELMPSFTVSATHATTMPSMTTSRAVKNNSYEDQTEALLSVIKIIANHMNTKYHLGNELFTTQMEGATLTHSEIEAEMPNRNENANFEVNLTAVPSENSTSFTELPNTAQLSQGDRYNSTQNELRTEPSINDKQHCSSDDDTCFLTLTTSTPTKFGSTNLTEHNMSAIPTTIRLNKPNLINEINHYNHVHVQTIKPTKTEPSHIGQTVSDTFGDKNSKNMYNTSLEEKQPSMTKNMHPDSPIISASNRSFTTESGFKPTGPSLMDSTPVILSPPMAYILLIFNVPWITVCLHDKELQKALAEELTTLVKRAIKPEQIILLSTGSQRSSSWMLVSTQADICQELEHTQTSPSVLVVYVVDAMGEADQILTSLLGKGLLHNEIKFAGTAFQNVVLEVRIFPTDASTVTHDATGTNNYFGLIAAFTISGIAGTSLVLLCILLLILRHRHLKYRHHQQCRPVTDNYSLDSISIYSSFRQKRNSKRKRSYLNLGFNDPNVPSHQVNFAGLANVCLDQDSTIEEEYMLIPMKSSKLSDMPPGAEEKNRYANIIPIPETRVSLTLKAGEPNSDYINANYVQCLQGHKGRTKMYIACQAPMENTMADFWRMVWEQQSRVIIMLTQFEEDNVPKCVQYFPESEFSCHKVCGDYQVTLKNKEVLQNYTISMLQVRDLERNLIREVTHFWYTAWPPQSVPTENWSIAAMLLEVRSHMFKNTGPTIVHCSTGNGRTGTVIAIDICMRDFEDTRMVDIPRCVSNIRKQRGGAVQNKEQYCFIYQVLNEYAIRLINPSVRSSFRSDTSTFKR